MWLTAEGRDYFTHRDMSRKEIETGQCEQGCMAGGEGGRRWHLNVKWNDKRDPFSEQYGAEHSREREAHGSKNGPLFSSVIPLLNVCI